MWWIFGLIIVLIVLVFAWFFDKKIKEGNKWTLDDKCTFGVFTFFAFVGGGLVTLLLVGIFIFLFFDFIKYIKNK